MMQDVCPPEQPSRGTERGDDGFTLAETLVSLAIIAVVLASFGAFHLRGMSTTTRLGDLQAATRIATDAMERVRLLSGAALLSGRSQSAVTQQWVAPKVSAYLHPAKTLLIWEDPPVAATATLPAVPQTVTVDGVSTLFQQSWYVGKCWKTPASNDCVVVPPASRSAQVPMYRAIVAVTWHSNQCASSQCSFVTDVLLSAATVDPQFRS